MAIKKRTTSKQKAASRRNLEKARAAKKRKVTGYKKGDLDKQIMKELRASRKKKKRSSGGSGDRISYWSANLRGKR